MNRRYPGVRRGPIGQSGSPVLPRPSRPQFGPLPAVPLGERLDPDLELDPELEDITVVRSPQPTPKPRPQGKSQPRPTASSSNATPGQICLVVGLWVLVFVVIRLLYW